MRIFSLTPCCTNYYSLFYWKIFSLFHIFLFYMPVYCYKQNGSSQMFLQSVFSAHYWDISCIYMLLTLAATTFLYISPLNKVYPYQLFLWFHPFLYKIISIQNYRYLGNKKASSLINILFSLNNYLLHILCIVNAIASLLCQVVQFFKYIDRTWK